MPSFLNSQHRAKLHSCDHLFSLSFSSCAACYHPTDCSFLTHFSRYQDERKIRVQSAFSVLFPFVLLLLLRISHLGFSHLLTFLRSEPHTNLALARSHFSATPQSFPPDYYDQGGNFFHCCYFFFLPKRDSWPFFLR